MKKDPVMQDRTQFVLNVVRKYMDIVNTTILDMTPKYLIMSLVQDVSFDFIKFFGPAIRNKSYMSPYPHVPR